jgi:hypothetical protein
MTANNMIWTRLVIKSTQPDLPNHSSILCRFFLSSDFNCETKQLSKQEPAESRTTKSQSPIQEELYAARICKHISYGNLCNRSGEDNRCLFYVGICIAFSRCSFKYYGNMFFLMCKSKGRRLVINSSYHTCISSIFNPFPYNITYSSYLVTSYGQQPMIHFEILS